MWNPQIEAFKNDYRVIAYDVRGHGKSDAGDMDFSINLFVVDLINLMDAFYIDKAILCGLSMGGYIALNAVESHPHRFSALVLCDTNCKADPASVIEQRMKTIRELQEEGLEKYTDESVKKLFAPDSFNMRTYEVEAVRKMIMKTPVHSICNTLRALSSRDESCTGLSEISIPVLIMVGKEDAITPPVMAQLMHEKIKDSKLEIIQHAGHLCNLENPMEFNEKLKTFLSSVKLR
jgi:3-oxoadipate enol-lactonase